MSRQVVSIITPSYNSSEFISETIQSVLDQTFTDWEMIIVDDCSIDNSVRVIQSFIEKDTRIKLIQLSKNSGTAIARNVAIKAARGRYIAFLDGDDFWLPDKLEKQLAFMQMNNYAFSYTSYDKIDENSKVFSYIGAPERVSYYDLLKTCSIGCLTSMYDAEYFGKVYMPNNTKREDFATWLILLKKIKYAYGMKETLAKYRVYNRQASGDKIRMAYNTWQLYRKVEGLSRVKACFYFSHYAVRGLLRTKFPRIARILGVL